jgi:peptidoglycan pentaglycine glycine transferase (the first glycine)
MQIKVLTSDDRKAWNEFVRSLDGSILQSYEWGELKERSGWSPLRISLIDSGNIVAGASILIKRLPLKGKSIFYVPQGPVVQFEKDGILTELLTAIRGQARSHGAIELKIDPIVPEGKGIEKILADKGFVRNKKQIQPRATLYVDLKADPEDLIKTFEEKTRYNIRLAEKKGVEVRLANTDEGVDQFYRVYEETASRDKFIIHPLSYYKSIKACLIDRGLASLFMAYYKGKPVAGVFIFNFGKRIWYMYGASSNEARNVMPNHALHWHVIKWARQAGYELYDLWGIPANPNENHPLWGVYRFKKGFNGRLVKYVGVYDLPYSPPLYFLFEKGASLFKNVISLIKKGKIEDSLGE